MYGTVTIQMKDLLDEKLTIIERTISDTVIQVHDNSVKEWECNKFPSEEKQTELIKTWISERGNSQHDTLLEYVSHKLNSPRYGLE